MEKLDKYTPTELLNMLNKIKTEHDNLKTEIVEDTNQVDLLDQKINNDLLLLSELEKDYILIIEEINNR